MQINPYLIFNGQCEAAFKYYEQCLGGKILGMMSFGETPAADQVPEEWRNKIMHTRLAVGDQILMGSDNHPSQPYEGIKGNSVSINVETPAEAERIFKALEKNGTVKMAMQQTFWAQRFGMCIDQFGVPWMVNCEQPAEVGQKKT